jgi:hypothetical protein
MQDGVDYANFLRDNNAFYIAVYLFYFDCIVARRWYIH